MQGAGMETESANKAQRSEKAVGTGGDDVAGAKRWAIM